MDIKCSDFKDADIQILIHHIYEYKKGIRNLVLHTMKQSEQAIAEYILNQKEMCYFIKKVNSKKINIFFGNPDCVKIIKSFGCKSLNEYTPEQDFMLGIMLGYCRKEQFVRYLNQQKSEKQKCMLKTCKPKYTVLSN